MTTLLHLLHRLVGNHMFVKVGAAAIYSGLLLPSNSALRKMRKRQLLTLQNAAEIAGRRIRARQLLALLNQRARGARDGRVYDRPLRLLAVQSQGALGAREGRE